MTNGAHNDGAVFKLTPAGGGYKEKILYSFRGGKDGSDPRGTLVENKKGALFGTTFYGGSSNCGGGCGTVFKLTPSGSGYKKSIIYSFAGGLDGANPAAGLLMDKSGALYGTTYEGGGGSACSAGCGTVYELKPKKSKYVESILNEFVSGTDGADPAGGLIVDNNGVLYGTTVYGGSTMCGGVGCGTVYKMTPNGNSYDESAVYAFQGAADGQSPEPTLLLDSAGALYGTTLEGGESGDFGTFFKLVPVGSQYIVANRYLFQGGGDGASPWAGLVLLPHGVIAGATLSGGSKNQGAIFEMKPRASEYTETVQYSFKGGKTDGAGPYGTPLVGKDGMLYGTTGNDGKHGGGVAFKIKP